jgi:hypothetical protein
MQIWVSAAAGDKPQPYNKLMMMRAKRAVVNLYIHSHRRSEVGFSNHLDGQSSHLIPPYKKTCTTLAMTREQEGDRVAKRSSRLRAQQGDRVAKEARDDGQATERSRRKRGSR